MTIASPTGLKYFANFDDYHTNTNNGREWHQWEDENVDLLLETLLNKDLGGIGDVSIIDIQDDQGLVYDDGEFINTDRTNIGQA